MFTWIHCLAALTAIGVVALCLVKRRLPFILYFSGYAICLCVLCVGVLLEGLSPSFDGALTALRAQYFGIPFLGPFILLFGLDYSGHQIRKRYVAAFLLPAAFVSVVVNTPALMHWYYQALDYVAWNTGAYLAVTPGSLYYPSMLYSFATAVVGVFYITRFLACIGRKRRHLAVFLIMAALPLSAIVLRILVFGTAQYDPIPLTLLVNALFTAFCLLRFHRRDWLPLGRAQAVENMKDAYVLVSVGGKFLDANTAAARYFPGLAKLERGAKLNRADGLPEIFRDCREGTHSFAIQNGTETLHLRISCTNLTADGRVVGHCHIIYDDTENQQLMKELHALATHDALTNLLNRGTFFLYATRDFDLSRRNREPGSLLMLDVDLFKNVNDVHGHLWGDRVLAAISETIRVRLRHTDLCGRYGGEEIVIWLPGTTAEGAGLIADIVRRAIESMQFSSEKGAFRVTVSVGVACVDFERHKNLDALVSDADDALYQAKRGGRNRVCVYSPEKQRAGH